MAGDSLAVVVDFIERWMLDRDRGGARESAYYEALYPGFEEEVRTEYVRLSESAGAPHLANGEGAENPERGERWIGPYKILRLVGEGGQGTVYEASDVRLGRRVAVKVLNGLGSPNTLRRFHREAALLASMDHPALCTLYEAGHHDGNPFLAMRYVEGRSLAELIREQRDAGPGPVALPGTDPSADARTGTVAVLRLIEQIARGLDFAHEKGVVHRDVKPANVILDSAGKPIVLDFGLARGLDGESIGLTFSGDVLGTPGYLAPEHLGGQAGDRRVDVYALGVTLYECLTKRRPFEAATREALFKKIMEDPPLDPRPENRAIGRDLLAVIETALAKNPDKRYGSAAALANDLAAVADGRPVMVRRAGVLVRTWQWTRRHRTAAAVLAVVLIAVPVIAGLGGYLAARIPDLEFADTKRQEIQDENDLLTAYFWLEERADGPSRAAPLFERLVGSPFVGTEAIAGLAFAHLEKRHPEKALETLDRHSVSAASPSFARLRQRALEALLLPCPADVAEIAATPPRDAFDLYFAGVDAMARAPYYGLDPEAWERAYQLLDRAVRHPRARPRYHFARAKCLGPLGEAKPEEARETARLLQEFWPDSGIAWHWSGVALSHVDSEASAMASAQARRLLPKRGSFRIEPLRPASRGDSLTSTSRPSTDDSSSRKADR